MSHPVNTSPRQVQRPSKGDIPYRTHSPQVDKTTLGEQKKRKETLTNGTFAIVTFPAATFTLHVSTPLSNVADSDPYLFFFFFRVTSFDELTARSQRRGSDQGYRPQLSLGTARQPPVLRSLTQQWGICAKQTKTRQQKEQRKESIGHG